LKEGDLSRALEEQKKWGGRLGRILREMNLVEEDVLLKALSKQLGLPRAELSKPDVPQEILQKIDATHAAENRLCPERYDAQTRTLQVAVEDHLNLSALDQLRSKAGVKVKTSLASSAEINDGLALLFPSHPAVMPSRAQGRNNMAVFETKDFGKVNLDLREATPVEGVRMLETADFSEAASQVKEDSTAAKRSRLLSTDDFSEAAKRFKEDEEN
jgi:hypothetical protein